MIPWWAPYLFGLLFIVGVANTPHRQAAPPPKYTPSASCLAAQADRINGGKLDVALWCK